MAVAFCQLFMSLDEENPIRLSVYRKAIGVESGIVEKADMEGQNGVIHIINRVIFPANISAGDLLNQEGNFTWVSLSHLFSVKTKSVSTLRSGKRGTQNL